MSDLHFRPVTASDLSVLCAFPRDPEVLFFCAPRAEYPLTVEQLSGLIETRADSTVVEMEGRVVGFANFYRFESEGLCAIGNVMVDPDARGRGIASALIRYMTGLAYSKYAAKEVMVSCFNRNVAGLLLYSKLGFKPDSVEARQDYRGEAVALLHLKKTR